MWEAVCFGYPYFANLLRKCRKTKIFAGEVAQRRIFAIFAARIFLRGGVQFPTGGESPRLPFEGLNRWNSGADGERV